MPCLLGRQGHLSCSTKNSVCFVTEQGFKLVEHLILYLPDTFSGSTNLVADFIKCPRALSIKAEARHNNHSFSFIKLFYQSD